MPDRQSRHSPLVWRKSRATADQGTCVEIACDVGVTREGPSVLVRDSRDPSGAVLAFSPAEWSAFLRRLRAPGAAF
ncbi:MAG TPA: DUF397 domain-containing protein [Trebonia sp.]|jgi:hypothetical protein|nr:DUF397 domain-containing protein [Trebonia sp.]